MKHKYAKINGVNIHYVESGKGRLVILLHGFPEYWGAWKYQIKELSKYYRVVAPDLRGYNLSEKPKGVKNYRMELLTRDVKELINNLGEKKAVIVGHDWGGIIAWHFGMNYENMVDKLIIMNCPHPIYFKKVYRHPTQLLKSWYIFFFQIPLIPELLNTLFGKWALERMLNKEPITPGAFSKREITMYEKVFDERNSFSFALNYYRAWVRGMFKGYKISKINIPVLVLWGRKDAHVDEIFAKPPKNLVINCQTKFMNASHWIEHDKPKQVNDAIIRFINHT